MKSLLPNLVVGLFLSFNLSAQTPCIDGMAGDYPCSGYDLMSHYSLFEMGITSNGNDSWGWTDPETGDEYALMGGDNRTVFINITDPVNPVIVGYLTAATGPSLWRDIKVYNNYAFIVSEAAGHGMQVFDLTRLTADGLDMPVEFDADAYLDDFGHSHNIAINEETGYAYSIGGNTFDGGPHFINIQDPLNPVTVGGYDGDGYTHDAHIIVYNGPDTEHVGKEMFFGFNENSLTIVDVTDKTDPIQVSRTVYEQSAYTHQGWVNEDHTIVYMNDEIDESTFGFNTRTLIMDITDLDNPVLLEEHFGTTPAIDHNLYVKGDKLFESNYQSGLRVLQINDDPDNRLEEIAYFDVFPDNDNAGYSGTWSNYPYFASGNIVVSAFEGFFVIHESTVGISENDKLSFSAYPNPAESLLNVRFEEPQMVNQIVITDIVGQQVYAESGLGLVNESLRIDIHRLAAGIYNLTINNESIGLKFIVK